MSGGRRYITKTKEVYVEVSLSEWEDDELLDELQARQVTIPDDVLSREAAERLYYKTRSANWTEDRPTVMEIEDMLCRAAGRAA